MTKTNTVKQIWEQAIASFPDPSLESTGYSEGGLNNEGEGVFYEEEFFFDAGQVLGEELFGQGWIQVIRNRAGTISIKGRFSVEHDSDDHGTRIWVCQQKDYVYDIRRKVWQV